MKRGIRGASVLVGAGLLLLLAWLLASEAASALAAPAGAAAGTLAATPTILPTPTSVIFPKDTTAPLGPPMTSFVISATLTCGATVVALIVAAASLTLLLRSGYGPFLRALIYGPKALNTGGDAHTDSEYLPSGASRSKRSGRRASARSRRGGRD